MNVFGNIVLVLEMMHWQWKIAHDKARGVVEVHKWDGRSVKALVCGPVGKNWEDCAKWHTTDCLWKVVHEENVVPTLGWPLALLIECSQVENAEVLNLKGRPGSLRGSLLASVAEEGGIRIALLVIWIVCGDLNISKERRKNRKAKAPEWARLNLI